jgi:hypothetical protein
MHNQAVRNDASLDVPTLPSGDGAQASPHSQPFLIVASAPNDAKFPFPIVGLCRQDKVGMVRLVHLFDKLSPAMTQWHGLRGSVWSRIYALKVELNLMQPTHFSACTVHTRYSCLFREFDSCLRRRGSSGLPSLY